MTRGNANLLAGEVVCETHHVAGRILPLIRRLVALRLIFSLLLNYRGTFIRDKDFSRQGERISLWETGERFLTSAFLSSFSLQSKIASKINFVLPKVLDSFGSVRVFCVSFSYRSLSSW